MHYLLLRMTVALLANFKKDYNNGEVCSPLIENPTLSKTAGVLISTNDTVR